MLCDVIENAKHEKEQLLAKGIAQGISQGDLKKAFDIAKSLLTEGMTIDFIMKCTKLSREEINSIKLD